MSTPVTACVPARRTASSVPRPRAPSSAMDPIACATGSVLLAYSKLPRAPWSRFSHAACAAAAAAAPRAMGPGAPVSPADSRALESACPGAARRETRSGFSSSKTMPPVAGSSSKTMPPVAGSSSKIGMSLLDLAHRARIELLTGEKGRLATLVRAGGELDAQLLHGHLITSASGGRGRLLAATPPLALLAVACREHVAVPLIRRGDR